MNANELAKELESVPAYRNIPMFQRAATMLRQQQAEIEALKYEKSSGVYDNEPIGYVYSVAGEPIKSAKINPEIPNGTPLYTHPAKTLTDEEIIKTMVQFDVYSADDQCLIEAGRAILKKASEK